MILVYDECDSKYNEDWLYEDAAWCYLARYPWSVTPELLFSLKQYMWDKNFEEDADGLDRGY